MEENQKPEIGSERGSDRNRLLFVLLVVLVICGGNAVSLLAGALLWKLGYGVGAAVAAVVIITAAAFAAAMLIVVRHMKKLGKR